MSIKNMHYDFKRKFNKIDSQSNRNLLIPEIDIILNEAQEIFIKLIAEPRLQNHLGFEVNSRSIEDIRSIVVPDHECDMDDSTALLPDDYFFKVRVEAFISKDKCVNQLASVIFRQHDDDFRKSSFYSSSFDWREVSALHVSKGFKLFSEDFEINSVILNYIRRPKYMHNAEDFGSGSYKLPSGELLSGHQNCELPVHVHSEIVDIAVMLAAGDIASPELEIKLNKLRLNQLN